MLMTAVRGRSGARPGRRRSLPLRHALIVLAVLAADVPECEAAAGTEIRATVDEEPRQLPEGEGGGMGMMELDPMRSSDAGQRASRHLSTRVDG
jgi:hypothetical protein